MTKEEFTAGPAFVLEASWPGDFLPSDEKTYHWMLSDFTAEQVMHALKALRGSKYRPTPGEIAAVLTPEKTAPTFDEMFAVLFSARGALAARDTEEKLEAAHPLIAAFAHRQGIQRLKELPVHDPDDGHWRKRELRDAWAAHVEASEHRELAVLASGEDAGLRRLDPLAALMTPRRELAEGTAA